MSANDCIFFIQNSFVFITITAATVGNSDQPLFTGLFLSVHLQIFSSFVYLDKLLIFSRSNCIFYLNGDNYSGKQVRYSLISEQLVYARNCLKRSLLIWFYIILNTQSYQQEFLWLKV